MGRDDGTDNGSVHANHSPIPLSCLQWEKRAFEMNNQTASNQMITKIIQSTITV